ncbi:MAG: antibiotic biosynthesis monooxygenase [Candidatus Riflebacteria bacterium]|nr:antibiotic biosynthesis monooxygenase [Candidatus Riflebacteria bacterium]
MYIVHVFVHVKKELIEGFKTASIDNASNSIKEPGVARFDVIQQADDPTRFLLVEVYQDEKAAMSHKETSHYKIWRDKVAEMMAEPRTSVKYSNVFPSDNSW